MCAALFWQLQDRQETSHMQNQERRPQSLFCRHCVDTPWLHSSNTYADIIVQMEQKARLEEFIKDIETGSEIQGFTRWCVSCICACCTYLPDPSVCIIIHAFAGAAVARKTQSSRTST